jgi:hypothetical protein
MRLGPWVASMNIERGNHRFAVVGLVLGAISFAASLALVVAEHAGLFELLSRSATGLGVVFLASAVLFVPSRSRAYYALIAAGCAASLVALAWVAERLIAGMTSPN